MNAPIYGPDADAIARIESCFDGLVPDCVCPPGEGCCGCDGDTDRCDCPSQKNQNIGDSR